MQVARVAGAEAEMDMGFAGLHQLLVPFLGGLERLPAPQRQALGSAFGLVAGPPPDRFLVGLAALTLLTDAIRGPSGGAVSVPGAGPAQRHPDAVAASGGRPHRGARADLERGQEPAN